MPDIVLPQEDIFRAYHEARFAQLLLAEISKIQAQLAVDLNNNEIKDIGEYYLWDLEETVKALKKAKRVQDSEIEKELVRQKIKRKPKKTIKRRVVGNVITLNTRAKRKPKS